MPKIPRSDYENLPPSDRSNYTKASGLNNTYVEIKRPRIPNKIPRHDNIEYILEQRWKDYVDDNGSHDDLMDETQWRESFMKHYYYDHDYDNYIQLLHDFFKKYNVNKKDYRNFVMDFDEWWLDIQNNNKYANYVNNSIETGIPPDEILSYDEFDDNKVGGKRRKSRKSRKSKKSRKTRRRRR